MTRNETESGERRGVSPTCFLSRTSGLRPDARQSWASRRVYPGGPAFLLLLVATLVGTAAEPAPLPRPVIERIPAPHPAPPKPADGYEVVVFAPHRPIRVRVSVQYEGQPLAGRWQAAVRKLFDAFDRNHDGTLDEKELRNVPSDSVLANLIQTGIYNPGIMGPPDLKLLDADGDGRVTFDEWVACYRLSAGRVMQTRSLQPENPANVQATEELFKLLDRDGDGRLTRDEVSAAERLIATHDADEDECLSLGELVPSLANAGRFGTPVVISGRVATPALPRAVSVYDLGQVPEDVTTRIITDYDKDGDRQLSLVESGFDAATFARLDTDGDGFLSHTELDAWRTGPADLEVTLSVAAKSADCKATVTTDTAAVAAGGFTVRAGESGQLVVRHGRQSVEFRATTTRSGRAALQNQWEPMFRQAAGKKGYVEDADFAGDKAVQLQMLRVIVDPADFDGDGKLTRAEFDRYFGLLDGFVDLGVALTPTVQTPTLFQMLDENRDGRLGVRELRTAFDRLIALEPPGPDGTADAVTRAAIQPTVTVRLTRAFEQVAGLPVVIDRNFANVAVPQKGPVWFRKMDRNGDGDISRAEFLGTRAEFDAIDTDRDGLISLEEAEAYDRKLRAGSGAK